MSVDFSRLAILVFTLVVMVGCACSYISFKRSKQCKFQDLKRAHSLLGYAFALFALGCFIRTIPYFFPHLQNSIYDTLFHSSGVLLRTLGSAIYFWMLLTRLKQFQHFWRHSRWVYWICLSLWSSIFLICFLFTILLHSCRYLTSRDSSSEPDWCTFVKKNNGYARITRSIIYFALENVFAIFLLGILLKHQEKIKRILLEDAIKTRAETTSFKRMIRRVILATLLTTAASIFSSFSFSIFDLHPSIQDQHHALRWFVGEVSLLFFELTMSTCLLFLNVLMRLRSSVDDGLTGKAWDHMPGHLSEKDSKSGLSSSQPQSISLPSYSESV